MSDPGLPSSCLFFIHDFASGTRFLVDIDAEVSVIPPSLTDRHHKTKLTLQAVNGSSIPTYGTRSLTLNIRLCRTLRWIFVIADIQSPILGADFLCHFALLVDVKHIIVSSTLSLNFTPKVHPRSLFPLVLSCSSLLLHQPSMPYSRSFPL